MALKGPLLMSAIHQKNIAETENEKENFTTPGQLAESFVIKLNIPTSAFHFCSRDEKENILDIVETGLYEA